MSLDFGQTCPAIDDAISECKETLKIYLGELIEELCPLLRDETKEEIVNSYKDNIYKELEEAFENTRKTNEQMREAADDQIYDLKDQIEEAQERISEQENTNCLKDYTH